MKFIEMTGRQLQIIIDNGREDAMDLAAAGVDPESLVRINQQGDIEVRRQDRWDVVGGLLGNYEQRARQCTGLDWA